MLTGQPASTEPLALYIHWPFCLAKCPYCDFNSHVRATVPQARFGAALERELEHEATQLGRRRLTSIFFGGGTPSLMAPETVANLIARATTLFDPAPDLEITLEANPTSVEAARLRDFAQAGSTVFHSVFRRWMTRHCVFWAGSTPPPKRFPPLNVRATCSHA